MKREYYVAHSSHKRGKSYINTLTFVPESTIARSEKGTYNYYHNGELVWSVEDSIKLFNDYVEGTFFDYDPYEAEEVYPVWKKYSESCDSWGTNR